MGVNNLRIKSFFFKAFIFLDWEKGGKGSYPWFFPQHIQLRQSSVCTCVVSLTFRNDLNDKQILQEIHISVIQVDLFEYEIPPTG